ncbi:MAG: hypothetical protein KF773_24855 [Deltaproteobacteria bacterium]|nr:hypothetical protein [Deltaproteobacteria bacterium]
MIRMAARARRSSSVAPPLRLDPCGASVGGIMQEKRYENVKRELTAAEEANLRVLQKIRPSIVTIVNAVLASHGLDVVLARLDFADAASDVGRDAERQAQCPMCCCIGGYYSCCTAC